MLGDTLGRTAKRSCFTCRQRKVRCDKLSPCSNCQRAEMPCVYPVTERPPRWARRLRQQQLRQQPPQLVIVPDAAQPSHATPLDLLAPDAKSVLDRLANLEALVQELGSPHTATPAVPTPLVAPGHAAYDPSPMSGRFGRLILDDESTGRSRYVSSGFWSKINDELDELRAETRTLAGFEPDDGGGCGLEKQSSQTWKLPTLPKTQRTPTERHAFLFRHNISPPLGELPDYRPPLSQIPFLFQVYVTNINGLTQIVHVPTMNKTIQTLLEDAAGDQPFTPANESLMFSIYYAATASMDDEDVAKSFALSKAEMLLKYRLGFELSLAKADFLNTADLTVTQALLIFLMLVRRHDSPRFVWMLTGLATRMGLSLGLQRDGSHFSQSLTPFEVEMRRRTWWTLCALDVRSSEDQGTDLTIQPNSYDTQLPLNINDNDIGPDTDKIPDPREAITDMTYALLSFEITRLAQHMMALAASASRYEPRLAPELASASPPMPQNQLLEEQRRMLDKVYIKLDSIYLRYAPDTNGIVYWTGVTIARLVMAKMSLILYLPTLIGKNREEAQGDEELRARLLSAAVEVAEYNHALLTERACSRWRWLYDTYTQWHAIAFLLMETGRRPWDPAVERAWVALHSPHLIPARCLGRSTGHNNAHPVSRAASIGVGCSTSSTKQSTSPCPLMQHFWLPLHRLLARSRRHRASELVRLNGDSRAARYLEATFDIDVAEGRSRPLSNPASVDLFRSRWRKIVGLDESAPEPTTPPVATSSKKLDIDFGCANGTTAFNLSTDAPGQHISAGHKSVPAGSIDTSACTFGGSEIINDPSILTDEELYMEMDAEIDIDWGNWFASIPDFERDGSGFCDLA